MLSFLECNLLGSLSGFLGGDLLVQFLGSNLSGMGLISSSFSLLLMLLLGKFNFGKSDLLSNLGLSGFGSFSFFGGE